MLDVNHYFAHYFRSTLWYPEAGLHYPVPGLPYHYLVGPERSVHNRERPFHDPEAEAGILQVGKNDLKNTFGYTLSEQCSTNK